MNCALHDRRHLDLLQTASLQEECGASTGRMRRARRTERPEAERDVHCRVRPASGTGVTPVPCTAAGARSPAAASRAAPRNRPEDPNRHHRCREGHGGLDRPPRRPAGVGPMARVRRRAVMRRAGGTRRGVAHRLGPRRGGGVLQRSVGGWRLAEEAGRWPGARGSAARASPPPPSTTGPAPVTWTCACATAGAAASRAGSSSAPSSYPGSRCGASCAPSAPGVHPG
mmetsp:Transcript_23471/g.73550  ORF Transcript_23471/g.73550 Transcript_23471/m.73550 type:complete len:227 (-) Transcript_23471:417-1097(-)